MMARFAMGTKDKSKELSKSLTTTVEDFMPIARAQAKINQKLLDVCGEALKETIKEFRDSFVGRVSTAVSSLDDSDEGAILPEGTRFFRKNSKTAVFVVEQKPSVRTLTFRARSSGDIFDSGRYRLALPYMVYIPIFQYQGSTPYFSSMCVAYRTAPIGSLNDMLYHPNLPNLSHPQDGSILNGPWPPEGNVKEFSEMVMCQGFHTTDRDYDEAFKVNPASFCDMFRQLTDHFWSSEFTDELSVYFTVMQKREPKYFGSLEKWEKASKKDPLFPLKIDWIPAIRLKILLNKIGVYHDQGLLNVSSEANKFVSSMYNATWAKLLEKWAKTQGVDATEIFTRRLDEILKKFALEMARGVAVNDTVRRTVQIAVKQALIEAVK